MKINVGVVDYGMGNLHSVAKAIALQGARVTVTDNQSKLKNSDLLVLPGVGSFGAAMTTLRKKNLDRFICDWIAGDRPYLGICLGFQLLFDRSEESPRVKGLGVFSGSVVKFRLSAAKRRSLRVPHMGWNSAVPSSSANEYFKGLSEKDYFYFVHSYYPVPRDSSVVSTRTDYGSKFCSSVAKGNLFACQFHPEKSGDVGLRLLRNVLQRAA